MFTNFSLILTADFQAPSSGKYIYFSFKIVKQFFLSLDSFRQPDGAATPDLDDSRERLVEEELLSFLKTIKNDFERFIYKTYN